MRISALCSQEFSAQDSQISNSTLQLQLQLETPTQTPKYSNTQTPNENVPHNILILSKIANLTQLISDGQYCIIFTKLEKPSTRQGEKSYEKHN